MKNKKSVNKAMKQIRELPQDELVARDGALRKEKFLLRAQAKSGQLESPAKIRTARAAYKPASYRAGRRRGDTPLHRRTL